MRPYPEQPDRVHKILEELAEREIETAEPSTYSQQWITTLHDPNYVEFIEQLAEHFPADRAEVAPTAINLGGTITPESSFFAKLGHYFFDPATPLVPQTGTAAFTAVDCALSMADVLLSGTNLAGALSRPPGHHAMHDRGGGYCIFNNVAIAANYLSSKGKSVTVLDLDYHHGNGTQQLFYARDDVQYVSVHADTRSNYPFYWGFEDQTGVDAGEGHTHNLPVSNYVDADSYLTRVKEAIGRINDYNPEIVLVSMGFDCYIEDPIAGLSLTISDYSRIGELLQQFTHTGILLEGGYAIDAIGQCFANLYEAARR